MNRIILFWCLWLGISLQSQAQTNTLCKEVVGYYPGWQWYDRTKLVNPTSIHYNKYSIINYAFFKPLSDGTITISDPWGDKNLLLGPINWAVAPAGYDTGYDFGNAAYHQSNKKLSDYCHQNNVKMLISVGGWSYSGNFSSIAANAVKRAKFAHDCNRIVKIYNLDGIDLDWEYPGFNDGTPDHNGVPADKHNFTILLQEVRDSLDAIEPAMNRSLLLTAAVGAAPARMADVEWDNVKNLLDIINIMSYDFYGAWDATTGHNAPLYPANGVTNGFSCAEAVNNLLAYGVSPDKLTMGLAFYGRTQMCANTLGLGVPGTGAVDNNFSVDEGTPLYYNVLNQLANYDYHWDNISKVPYLTGKNGHKGFVSYDNEASIEAKAQFINEKNLRGGIIWEITGDYTETAIGSGVIAGTPLTDKMNYTFCHPLVGTETKINDFEYKIYPNPTENMLYIYLPNERNYKLELLDIMGRNLLTKEMTNSTTLSFNEFIAGIYFVRISTENKSITQKILKN